MATSRVFFPTARCFASVASFIIGSKPYEASTSMERVPFRLQEPVVPSRLFSPFNTVFFFLTHSSTKNEAETILVSFANTVHDFNEKKNTKRFHMSH